MAENKVNPPSLPTSKPNLDKLDNKKTSVVGVEKVAKSNPEMILSNSKTKKLIITLVSLILCVIIATTVIVIVSPKSWQPNDINIDFQVGLESINKIEFDQSTSEPTSLMPGDTMNAKFSIKSVARGDSNAEVYVRVMFFAEVDNNYNSNVLLFDTSSSSWAENWIMGADGFAYFKRTLKADQSVDFLNKVVLNKNLDNSYQGKTIKIVFYGECLQAGQEGFSAIESMWQTAPTLWKNQFRLSEA